MLSCLRDIRLRFWVLATTGWIVLATVMLLPPASPVRVIAVFLFVLAGPGYPMSAVVARDAAERWVLTIALSAALAIVVTVVMTVIRNESLPLRIAVLAAVTTVAAVVWGIHDSLVKSVAATSEVAAVKA